MLCQRRSSCWKYQKLCSYFEIRYHYGKMVEKRIYFLVSPYCTLLFFKKEIIKFSEVTLVAFHNNCLIGCITIVQEYCQCGYLLALSKTTIKTPKENVKFVQIVNKCTKTVDCRLASTRFFNKKTIFSPEPQFP